MPVLFSFILVNFQSAKLLPAWFASPATTGLASDEYEVIIVNNDIAETEILENLKHQYNFTLIHTKNNLGFGTACNLGARKATSEILGFINPDTQFLSGDLHTIHNQFQSNPSLGIIGLKLVTQAGGVQNWSAGTCVTLWDILSNNLGVPESKALWQSTQPVRVDWVSGASLFIPFTLFQEINGFDEAFFLYFEDIDLCKRVLAQGKSILYFPTISLEHLSGQSSASQKQQKRYYYQSQDTYFAKHRPKWEGLCIKILRKIVYKN